jgi:hypothetical protein
MSKLDKLVQTAREQVRRKRHFLRPFKKDASKNVSFYLCPKCGMGASVTVLGNIMGRAIEYDCPGVKQ